MRWCANCGALEPSRWMLMIRPDAAFRIRKDGAHDADLCSFECEREWHAKKMTERNDR